MQKPRQKLPSNLYWNAAKGCLYGRVKINGKDKRKSFRGMGVDAASIACVRWRRAMREVMHEAPPEPMGAYTWGSLITDVRRALGRERMRGVDEFLSDLGMFQTFRPVRLVSEITPAYVEGFVDWRSTTPSEQTGRLVSASTISRQVMRLRKSLRIVAGEHPSHPNHPKRIEQVVIRPMRIPDFDEDPEDSGRMEKHRRLLEPWEVQKILLIAPHHLRRLWHFVASSGCRVGEAMKLRWSDIRWAGDTIATITVRRTNSKTKKPRVIDCDDKLDAQLARERDAAPDRKSRCGSAPRPDLVFVTENNGAWDHRRLLNEFYKYAQIAGIEDARPASEGGLVDQHALRGCFATEMLARGMSLQDVAEALGHSTPTITLQRYAKASRKRRIEILNEVDWTGEGAPQGGTIAAVGVG